MRKLSSWIRFVECRRHRCPQTWSQDLFSTRPALNGSSWERGAGATVANRSGGFITARSLECAFICTPINGWQPPNNPTVKTFNSAFDVGFLIVHLRADHLINIIMQVANCGLTLPMWLGRADAFRRAMPTPHCPMPFYSALYHPASGIPTNWACCVIRSSWGSAETGLVQWEATLAEASCAIRAEALWVLRTLAAGFHTRRGALRGYGAPAVGFTSGPPDCCHLRPARTRCKSLNLCVLWGTWLELASDSDGVALEARGWLSLLLFVPDLTLSALHGESPKKRRKRRRKKLDSSALTRGKIALIQQWVLRSEVTHFSLKAPRGWHCSLLIVFACFVVRH